MGLALAALNVLRGISGDERVPGSASPLLILAPTLMTLLQLAAVAAREIDADRAAALLTGDPLGVASAISRLDSSPGSPLDDLMPPVPARKVPLPSMLRYPPPPIGASRGSTRSRRRPCRRSTSPRARAFR